MKIKAGKMYAQYLHLNCKYAFYDESTEHILSQSASNDLTCLQLYFTTFRNKMFALLDG